jgi:hypothetical protein
MPGRVGGGPRPCSVWALSPKKICLTVKPSVSATGTLRKLALLFCHAMRSKPLPTIIPATAGYECKLFSDFCKADFTPRLQTLSPRRPPPPPPPNPLTAPILESKKGAPRVRHQRRTTNEQRRTAPRPMTDVTKNLSYLTPTSVMNLIESTPDFTRILTPHFSPPHPHAANYAPRERSVPQHFFIPLVEQVVDPQHR